MIFKNLLKSFLIGEVKYTILILKISIIKFTNPNEILKYQKNNKILVVGLGNKNITSDSLGYLVIEKINYVKKQNP